MDRRARPTAILGVVLGIAVAAAVVFLGLRATEGDPELPEGAGVTASTAPLESPKHFVATIKRPSDGAGFPTRIAIGPEEQIAYDPELLFARIKSSPAGYLWLIQYDSDNNDQHLSTLAVEAGGKIQAQDILPWDAEVFQPLLDYAGVPLQVRPNVTPPPGPSATPAPTPTKVSIRGVEITLPVGVSMARIIGSCLQGRVCKDYNRYSIERDPPPPPPVTTESIIVFNDCGVQDYKITQGDTEMRVVLDSLNAIEWDAPSACE
jgi:hypothetical protein